MLTILTLIFLEKSMLTNVLMLTVNIGFFGETDANVR